MKKRKWIYIQEPQEYGITCDLCGGDNIAWSEFEHMIWCHDCQKDTPGTSGVFNDILPIHLARLLGMCFDRIELKTGERLYWTRHGQRYLWCHKKPKPEYDPQFIEGAE